MHGRPVARSFEKEVPDMLFFTALMVVGGFCAIRYARAWDNAFSQFEAYHAGPSPYPAPEPSRS